jgi:hypothetical protein
MDHDDLGAVHQRLDLLLAGVAAGMELGVGLAVVEQRGRAVVLQEVGQAPPRLRLGHRHGVAAGHQFPHHAAREVRVAVVPA